MEIVFVNNLKNFKLSQCLQSFSSNLFPFHKNGTLINYYKSLTVPVKDYNHAIFTKCFNQSYIVYMQDPFLKNQVSCYISMNLLLLIETESLTITFVTCITHPFVTDADSSHLLLWTGNWTNMWWHLFNVCVCVYITPAYNHWFCFLYMHVLVKYTHFFRENLGYVVMVRCVLFQWCSVVYILSYEL